MSCMGRCVKHGCAFSARLIDGTRDEYCPECEIDHLRTALATAQAERDALQASLDSWVAWAQSSRCIYCGQEFIHDPHDQTGADEAKKVHVLTCAKHPMAQTQAALTEAHRVLRECHEILANYGYITDDDDPASLCCRIDAILTHKDPSPVQCHRLREGQ